jgi:hypothetical protein
VAHVTNPEIRRAVKHFWRTRNAQAAKQDSGGKKDAGQRGSVTGGKQMDGFVGLFTDRLKQSGVPDSSIFQNSRLELPGYFRPTKEWDLLVVHEGKLAVALEMKSHVGPSFGNNFNNRTEEAMGSALDVWTAFRENAFGAIQPWIGYLMLLEDSPATHSPVKVREPHFPVFKEFRKASYAKRYEEFCRRLVLERHYSAAALIMAPNRADGRYTEPSDELTLEGLVESVLGHIRQFIQ